MNQPSDGPTEPHHQGLVTIHIDRTEYRVPEGVMTGEQIRQIPTPPIGPDRDLYLEVHGNHDDRLIGLNDRVELENGMHFFTAPSQINPG